MKHQLKLTLVLLCLVLSSMQQKFSLNFERQPRRALNYYKVLYSYISKYSIYSKKIDNDAVEELAFFLDNKASHKSRYPFKVLVDYKMTNNQMDQMIVKVRVGEPAQDFFVLIDSGSTTLWITSSSCLTEGCNNIKHKFNESQSKTLSDTGLTEKITYGTGYANGKVVVDDVALGNSKPVKLEFLLCMDVSDSEMSDGILGLGYYYDKNEESIVKKLKSQGVVSKEIFTQLYVDNKRGDLIIGEYPDDIKERIAKEGNKDFLGFCDLDTTKMYWGCNMDSIFYGTTDQEYLDTKIPINDYFIFDTGSNASLLDQKTFDAIINNFFDIEELTNKCGLLKEDDAFTVLVCKEETDFSLLKPISFVFGNWVMYQKPEDYFAKTDGVYKFEFVTNADINVNIFGEPFLKKIYSIFNKEDEKFEFYGEQMFQRQNLEAKSIYNLYGNDPYHISLICFIYLMFSLVLGLGVYVYYKCIKHSKSKIYSEEIDKINNKNVSKAIDTEDRESNEESLDKSGINNELLIN